MSTNRAILFVALGLLLGLLIGISISKITTAENRKDNPTDIPIRVVTVTIDQGQRELLFYQVQKFADKWRYAIRIAPLNSMSEDFRVDMWRYDIKVLGAYSNDYGELHLAFSYTESTRPVPERYFDEEVSDLKSFIDEIPNATFTIEK